MFVQPAVATGLGWPSRGRRGKRQVVDGQDALVTGRMESSEHAPDSPPRPTPGDDAAPRTVTLASAVDIAGFRAACRRLWAEQTEPGRVVWRAAGDGEVDLFEAPPARRVAKGPRRRCTCPPDSWRFARM